MRAASTRLIVAILVGICCAVIVAVPARAGGPTSVLLAAPGSNAVGLYNDDPDYAELVDLIQAYDSDRSARPDDGRHLHAQGPYVTVTWMIHDVQVWRVDRIYYEAKNGPWIYTADNIRTSSRARWHQSTDPDKLVDLLERLELTGGEYAGRPVPPEFVDAPLLAGPGELAEPPDGSRSDDREHVASSATRQTSSRVDDWWWAAGGGTAGVIVGAVGAAMVYPRLWRVRPKRQRLIDY